MNKHISIFFDKPDYIKTLTNDPTVNVTGSVGSGKSTLGLKYANDEDYIVIGLDSIFGDKDPATRNKHTAAMKMILAKKYGTDFGSQIQEFLPKYYEEILSYIGKDNGVIEGGLLCNGGLINVLRGKILVKRTAKIKCYYRSVIRDLRNPEWSAGPNSIYKIKRFIHVLWRRIKLFDTTKIDNFINSLEEYQLPLSKNEL